MPIPAVNISITDGALGLLPESNDNVCISFGTCSSGTNATVYSFGTKEDVRSTLGVGPLVEELCYRLDVAGAPALACKVNASVAGSSSVVTNGPGWTGGTVTTTGAPADDYQVKVVIVTGGAVGTATFKISLDNGDTYSSVVATSASYALDANSVVGLATGMTVLFGAGTYVTDQYVTWTATAPYYNTTDLNTAFDAAIADARDWSLVHIVGVAASVATAASVAAAVQTKLTAAEAVYRYARAFMAIPTDTDANIIAGFASTVAKRVAACASYCELISVTTGRIYNRPASWAVAARACKVPISEDLGRFQRGALDGVNGILRDERAVPALADQRITTLRTFVGGVPGYYCTDGRLLATPTSDYKFVQHGRVIDKACRMAYIALLSYLNDVVRVNANGTIDEGDARAIETVVNSSLNAGITQPGYASAVSVQVNRSTNVLSTNTLTVDVRITPLGYNKTITTTIGFTNPALKVAA